MKIISMYLPQFHRVKENDEWWGEGFTEWSAVKAAVPLYKGHYQPHEPLKDNYYDLLNKETMVWQADLMKKYGIDGMCFYHYWFKGGRQILEKPAENLLYWTDIEMPFCFCWANETWARSWSNIREKNTWADTFEGEKKELDSGILLEQAYGEENDWRQHFEYLLSFFKDSRYMKVGNKPILMLYKTGLIDCLEDMLLKWRQWAIEAGFDGLYIIGGNTKQLDKKHLDATIALEPGISSRFLIKHNDGLSYDYRELWENILSYPNEENNYYEGLVGYDTTPRRGKNGLVVEGASPELFKNYLARLIAKSETEGKEFVFINAWNEWGEGMHLEPDKKNGYAYLEAVRYAKNSYKDIVYQSDKMFADHSKTIEILSEKCTRFETYWKVLEKWLTLKEKRQYVGDYIRAKGWKSVVVYGAGMMGRHLLKDLEDSKIPVAYIIDQKVEAVQQSYIVYLLKDELPQADVVIVSTTYDYEKITELLNEKGQKTIVFLENIISEMENKGI